jgi:hypothetical protein
MTLKDDENLLTEKIIFENYNKMTTEPIIEYFLK